MSQDKGDVPFRAALVIDFADMDEARLRSTRQLWTQATDYQSSVFDVPLTADQAERLKSDAADTRLIKALGALDGLVWVYGANSHYLDLVKRPNASWHNLFSSY